MGNVTINANSYAIYGDQPSAVKYHGGSLAAHSVLFVAASPTAQAQALVSATRVFDELGWQGTPNALPVLDTQIAFPRTGIVVNGQPVDSTTVPDLVVKGCYEFAALIMANPGVLTQDTTGSNIKRAAAGGGVEVEFFVPTLGISGILPTSVTRMVAPYLEGSSGMAVDGSFSSGADGTETSQFGTTSGDNGYDLNRGLV